MKRLAAAFLLIAIAASVYGQRTVTEITKSTNKQEDEKANSDAVPDVYAIRGDIERVVILRFKFKTDLLAGLNKAIEQEKIKNAVILAGAGSVRGYHYHSVSNRDFPSKNVLVKDPTHPSDILSMNGYIIDGRAHPHITFSDEEKAFGGHLEPGTQVFTFAVVTIGVLSDDVDLARVDDKTHR
jgi:predicted DNA-binding protein with PD1-like motif